MEKQKWIKYGFIILCLFSAGLFYSCNTKKDEAIKIELQSQEASEYTLSADEDINSIRDDSESDTSGKTTVNSTMEESTPDESTIGNSNVETYNNQTSDLNIPTSVASQNSGSTVEEGKMIYVHICGEVKNPDVYEVREDARLIDVIKLAGGLTKEAAGDFVNQASRISDGQQIYIPSITETKDKTPVEYSVLAESETVNAGTNSQQNGSNAGNSVANGNTEGTQGKVNLNTASKDELMTLTGIGEAKADSILSYREEHGGFKSIEEIKNIKGIKDSVFNKISDEITVN